MSLLVNIDVPDVERATAFYVAALGLTVGRRFEGFVELLGLAAPIYLLQNDEGSRATPAGAGRTYARHWTPVHLDVVVPDVRAACDRAVAAGAIVERPLEVQAYGAIAGLADPFGHGFCLIEFRGRGYDAIALPA